MDDDDDNSAMLKEEPVDSEDRGVDSENFDAVPRKKRPHTEVTVSPEEMEGPRNSDNSRLLDNMRPPSNSNTPTSSAGVVCPPARREREGERVPVCRSIVTGRPCPYGNTCKFSHDPTRFNEFKDHAYKTVMCAKWKSNGSCPYGDKCTFAHGLDQLRKPNAGPPPREFPQRPRDRGGSSPGGPLRDDPSRYGGGGGGGGSGGGGDPDSRYGRYDGGGPPSSGRGGGGGPGGRGSYDGELNDRDRSGGRDRDRSSEGRDKDRDSRDRDNDTKGADDDYYRLKKKLDETFDKKEDALDMVDSLTEELEIVRKDRDHLRNELEVVRKERDRAINQKEEAKKVIEGLHRQVTNSLRNFF